jgi:hypothetical protein
MRTVFDHVMFARAWSIYVRMRCGVLNPLTHLSYRIFSGRSSRTNDVTEITILHFQDAAVKVKVRRVAMAAACQGRRG